MDLVSIHQAASWLQATPHSIRQAARKLGIEVDCRINGIDCFLARDIERIALQLALTRGYTTSLPTFNTPLM